MGLRQVAQSLVAKKVTGDVPFFGRISVLDWNSRPDIVNHIFRFWAEGTSGIEDGDIIYYPDLRQYYILAERMPIYIKKRLRYISGIVILANFECTIQKLTSGSPDSFGKSTKSWATKLTTYCNMMSGILDSNLKQFNQLQDGFFNVAISRATEVIYKATVGDRVIINSKSYKIELVDETKYTGNAYICRVIEDTRT